MRVAPEDPVSSRLDRLGDDLRQGGIKSTVAGEDQVVRAENRSQHFKHGRIVTGIRQFGSREQNHCPRRKVTVEFQIRLFRKFKPTR